jgi:hypothetical protein
MEMTLELRGHDLFHSRNGIGCEGESLKSDSRCPSQHSKWVLPELKSAVLTHESVFSLSNLTVKKQHFKIRYVIFWKAVVFNL